MQRKMILMSPKGFYRKLKILLSPQEWRLRLLGLRVTDVNPGEKGLVLVQIDGLSFPDLQRAVQKGHMPFLRGLLRRKSCRLYPLYSGVPSNTPAFQGEFFFGKPQCVPAFQFRDKKTGRVFTMFDKNSAAEIEQRLLKEQDGLLAGGSSYANIFSGGAAESHLCAATADWVTALKAWNPYSILVTCLLNPWALQRGALLCLAECFLALFDFFRGLISGEDILEEFKFIFMRVFVSILMREMITAHARADMSRGLPVIHVNYFGYDEQAHRRGPSTRFAYWSLSGIDAAVRRLWVTARRTKRRHYRVWIYSDHGQEKVHSFAKENGKSIQRAAKELYAEIRAAEPCPGPWCRPRSEGVWGDTILSKRRHPAENKNEDTSQPLVTTLGPISQIYFPEPLSDDEKRLFAQQLIRKNPAIPLVAIPLTVGGADYAAGDKIYRLPRDAQKILGADHPYLSAVVEDLEVFFQHESRGDLVLFGWRSGAPPVSFSNENGSHAGLGPRETQAFALLPQDVVLPDMPFFGMRAADLRRAVLTFLGESKQSANQAFQGKKEPVYSGGAFLTLL